MISEIFKFKIMFGSLAVLAVMTGCNSIQDDNNVKSASNPPAEQVKTPPKSETVKKNTSNVSVNKKSNSLPFAPTYTPPQAAFDYASSIYKSSKGKPTGVYVCDGIVFVIVNIDLKKEKLRYIKGTAMLRSKVLLERKYKLPAKYKLTSRLLEDRNYTKLKHYRYALAYREKDILTLVKK